MRILVTGGGGFLGGAICRALLSHGDMVISYQRSPAPGLVDSGAQCVQGDLQDLDRLTRTAAGCDAVIHTAGKAGVWGPYEAYHQANVIGTKNAISACRANDIPYLVYTSSPSVVHGGGDIAGGDESLPYPEYFPSPLSRNSFHSDSITAPATLATAGDIALISGSSPAACNRPRIISAWGRGSSLLMK